MAFDKAAQLLELALMAANRTMGVTLDEVKSQFEVSHRTAQRMLEALGRVFPDVETRIDDDHRKRWTLPRRAIRELMTLRSEEAAALWPLFGTRLRQVLSDTRGDDREPLPDGPWSVGVVRWIIRHEWVTTLEDLVERRLMAVFAPRLTRRLLQALADCLVAEGRLSAVDTPAEVKRCCEQLRTHYGRELGRE